MIARLLLSSALALALLVVGPARAASAGGFEDDARRYSQRMPEASAVRIARTLAEARAKRLPTAPLEATATEGLARGIAPERIVAAVRSKALALGSARQALGDGSTEADLVAGAAALGAGIAPDSLARLRALRPGSAVVALVVMSDLVARGATGPLASSAVLRATRAGVRDQDLLRMREHIASDIVGGAAPADAILLRTRSFDAPLERPAQPRPSAGPPKLPSGDGP